MNRTDKGAIVDQLTERLTRSPSVYVTDFTGLRVKEMTMLRRRLRGAGVDYVVVKNTLALRALRAASVAGLEDVLAGPTGFVFAEADPVGAAKILAEFHKEFQKPTVKAGLVEGRRIGSQDVTRLATMPTREQLLGQLGGALQAPLQGFAGALNGLLYNWIGALEALRVQRANAA